MVKIYKYHHGIRRATHKNESLIPHCLLLPLDHHHKWEEKKRRKNFSTFTYLFLFLSLTIEYFNWINKESIKMFILIRRKEEFWPWSNLQIRHLLLLTNRFGKSIKAWLYYSTSILFQCLFIWFFFDIYWKMKYL